MHMKASEVISRITARVKNYLDTEIRASRMPPAAAACEISRFLSPLHELFSETRRHERVSSSCALPVENEEDPYIYRLIIEYLCSKGAFFSAETLLDELEEEGLCRTFPKQTPFFPAYSPWNAILPARRRRNEVLVALHGNGWDRIREDAYAHIRAARAAAVKNAGYFSTLYKLLLPYLIMDPATDSHARIRAAREKAVTEICAILHFEENSLVYYSKQSAILLSFSSAEFMDICALLGLLVTQQKLPALHRKYARNRYVFPPDTYGNEASLSLLYYVGAKMEEINIEPYSSEMAPIESAVPALFSFHSSFFCPVLRSECAMDNLPSLLTCGHVISSKAVEKIVFFKGAVFKCPYCPKEVNVKDIIRLSLVV